VISPVGVKRSRHAFFYQFALIGKVCRESCCTAQPFHWGLRFIFKELATEFSVSKQAIGKLLTKSFRDKYVTTKKVKGTNFGC